MTTNGQPDLDTRIREYARQVVTARGPMTPDERAQIVAILRGVQQCGEARDGR